MTRQEVNWISTPYGKEPVCPHCGSDLFWQECYNCEDGFSHHECGEDICCCLDPQPNVPCDVCDGEGGWWTCLGKCHHDKKEVR